MEIFFSSVCFSRVFQQSSAYVKQIYLFVIQLTKRCSGSYYIHTTLQPSPVAYKLNYALRYVQKVFVDNIHQQQITTSFILGSRVKAGKLYK